MEFTYDVFFSYRHRPLDGEITRRTFNAIESYRLPDAMRRRGFQDIRRAFRDTEELPVSRILTDTIDKALHATNCLVVVCSTDTPSSEWIDREVATFIEIGRADHIYPLLISGDPETSFPPSLKLVPDILDRVMDIRAEGNDIRKMMAKEETELLRVISGVVGCKESELLREHKMRKNRRTVLRAAAAAAAFAFVTAVSLGLMNLAQGYRDAAQRQEKASMRILNELTYDLPDQLTNVPGAYGRIAQILRRNTADIDAILRLSTDQEGAAYEAAANYEKLANAGGVLGRYDEALQAQDEAIGRYQALLDQGSARAGEQLASAFGNRATLLNAAGRYREADEAYERAITLLRAEENPDTLLLAQTIFNIGSNAADEGDAEKASAAFEESLALLEQLPKSREQLEALAKAYYNYGVLRYRQSAYEPAEEKLRASCGCFEELLTMADSLQNRGGYLQAASMLAACLTDKGDFEGADNCYAWAIELAEGMLADAENTSYLRKLADLYNNRGLGLNMRGRYREAETYYLRSCEINRTLSEETGMPADGALYALSLLNLGENAFKLPDYARSRDWFEQGLEQYERVLDSLGDYDRAQYYAWVSYYELIHPRDNRAALEAALKAVELQPNSLLANLNLAYACLYSGYLEDADSLLSQIAELGGGLRETIVVDLEAQRNAGMESAHRDEILEQMR